MTKKQAIKRILNSKMDDEKKIMLCSLASDFDTFKAIKKRYSNRGLLAACYKNLGFKFIGMYGINSIDDIVSCAENNSLL